MVNDEIENQANENNDEVMEEENNNDNNGNVDDHGVIDMGDVIPPRVVAAAAAAVPGNGNGARGGAAVLEVQVEERNQENHDDNEMEEDEIEDEEEEEDDNEEEEEEEEEEEDEEEMADEPPEEEDPDPPEEEEDGLIDGGVVPGCSKPISDCGLILVIECAEALPESVVPTNHPIYKKGVAVKIGLERNTKLQTVFDHYCKFANTHVIPSAENNNESKDSNKDASTSASKTAVKVKSSDLEFYHCSILQERETAESNTLMKNDRISYRPIRTRDRMMTVDCARIQRDIDRDYFDQMRQFLLKDSKCDVTLRCDGKIMDGDGYKQDVLSMLVKGHGSILRKRCKWLGKLIDEAKEERDFDIQIANRQAEQEQEDVVGGADGPLVIEGGPSVRLLIPDNDDEEDSILPAPVGDHELPQQQGRQLQQQQANAVEDDEDDDCQVLANNMRNNNGNMINNVNPANLINAVPIEGPMDTDRSRSSFQNAPESNAIVVKLSHPPEAVKLLLEYCYTNRVLPLGDKAFRKSYKDSDPNSIDPLLLQHTGPISPYSNTHGYGSRSSWPNNGRPTISLHVALAGIKLAEEAKLPRLSLMCEVAASQLVTPPTLLEALALCGQQYIETGNPLNELRQAVMVHNVLARGPRGVIELSGMDSFKRILKERSNVIVPGLLKGVSEAMKLTEGRESSRASGKKKRDIHEMTKYLFEKLDREDTNSREFERKKWRKERWCKRQASNHGKSINPYNIEDDSEHLEQDTSKVSQRTLILSEDGEPNDSRVRFFRDIHLRVGRSIAPPAAMGSGRNSSSRSRKRSR